jgi:acetamidase/formamidase
MGKIGHRPAERQLAYTFGGRIPVAHLRSGDVLEVYTEDCFGGRLRSVSDLSSWMLETPHLNPVSGPFLIEEAEPGDTLAIHIVSIVPARDWGCRPRLHTSARSDPVCERSRLAHRSRRGSGSMR